MTERADIAMRRSQSYWLLSRLFLEQPDTAMLRELAQGLRAIDDVAGAGGELVQLAAAVHDALGSEQAVTDLQVEYTRLLSGIGKANGPELYESMVREGRLYGESTEAVSVAYLDAGHPEFCADAGPPDHVGTELRFMSILCFHEMEAWQSDDASEAAALMERELCFLDDHVLHWVPELCERIAQLTTHSFYLAVGKLAAAACRQDGEELTALCHECA